MKYLLAVLSFFLLVPTTFAARHTYICSEVHAAFNNVTCSGNDWVFALASPQTTQTATPDPNYTWTNGVTYYFKVQSTGTVGNWQLLIANLGNCFSGDIPAQTVSGQYSIVNTCGTNDTFAIGFGSVNTNALVRYVCVSDVSYADCPDPPSLSVFQFWPFSLF